MADAVIYKIIDGDFINEFSVKLSPFEIFEKEQINSYVTSYSLKWLDCAKYKHKIVKREPRIVEGWFFKKNNIFIIFSDSESEIEFFLMRLTKTSNVKFNKVELFDDIIKGNRLISIVIKDINNSTAILNMVDINEDIFNELLKNDEIINATFEIKPILYFSVDKNSVISLPDNYSNKEILNAYEEIIIEYI